MWLVRSALKRPFTVAVMAILIFVMGVLSLSGMVVDIFPPVRLPVVAVIWSYPGLSALEMERRIVISSERAYSTAVSGIARIESESIPGIGLVKIFFHPDVEVGGAIAQISAATGTVLRVSPPGTQPPNIIQSDASRLPVAQLTLSSDTVPEESVYDHTLLNVRIRLFTIPGLSTPPPFGGKRKEIVVSLDPDALAAKGLSPADVVRALGASNVIIPAGNARIGGRQYVVTLNSSPTLIEQFNAIPLRTVGGVPAVIGDVARVSQSFADQNNIVRVDGRRATYLAILKDSEASTLAVIEAARDTLRELKEAAPDGIELEIDADQSVFVRAAIVGVLFEAIIASLLVSLLIALFLRSWRSTVVVCTSIPLAVLSGIIGLRLTGSSINVMTLGGLALSIGMLVDDATVEVENIHRNLTLGQPITIAILTAAREVAVPAIVATLSICIVFAPVALLTGAARFLFTPLALAVVFAMLASYLLSRTLVPVLARLLMAAEAHHERPLGQSLDPPAVEGFARFQSSYARALNVVLQHRRFAVFAAGLLAVSALVLLPALGSELFPVVDGGQLKLHVRAPPGTAIEQTEQIVAGVEAKIRETIPAEEIESINAMIGVPFYMNLAFVQTDNVGEMDADVQIVLRPQHGSTSSYRQRLRRELAATFPGSTFYFQPADIVSQILNFGLSAPINVQIEHADLEKAYDTALRLQKEVKTIPGAADVYIRQVIDYPELRFEVDREQAAQVGLSQHDIASNLLISLSSSALIAPTYYLNPINNANYGVQVKMPSSRIDSVSSLLATPVSGANAPADPSSAALAPGGPRTPVATLGNVAKLEPRSSPSRLSHYNVQRVIDLGASSEGRPLGDVMADIEEKIVALGELPKGMKIRVRGQIEILRESFGRLALGLVLAVLLVYCLMVVLFQSWLDPFVILSAVPGALVGVIWILAATGSSINVESLMGAIMSVGLAVSNSILLVNFANDLRLERKLSALQAAIAAASTRLRPILITALAMIGGMAPMALGLGEAGDQNAPLGRAVVGGVAASTLTTLFFVPIVYATLCRTLSGKSVLDARFQRETAEIARRNAAA
jgi:multidrug efflux pump subunit AcrB